MKHITIKSTLMRTVAVMLLTLVTSSASAQYYMMNVVRKNGEKVQYLVYNIDSVYFSSAYYEYVDLGLSVNWATFNVGATKPEEFGDYYAWGEIEPKTDYSWSNYKWCNGFERELTKYCNNSDYGFPDSKTTLDLKDDVAHVKWGGSWRMPTKAEIDELRNKCTWTWYNSGNTEFNGVAGYKVTSKKDGYTDRFIFLPDSGFGTDNYGVGQDGNYWSSSLVTSASSLAWVIRHQSSDHISRIRRNAGCAVRPVCPIDVTNYIVSSISIDSTSLSLQIGDDYLLKATGMIGDEARNVSGIIWRSDNNSVATISAEGLVTAISAGTATITASCQDKTANCVVTVREVQYEYVDLGLSVKWATFNVGATKPEEYGDYYAWGETEPKTDYSYSTYKWCNGSYNTQTKYNTESRYGTVDNKTTLDPEDDVAHVKWGGSWRMPTEAEQNELCNNCTWTWYKGGNTEFNGVAGYKVISNIEGYTDRSIFLPAAGYLYENGVPVTHGAKGYYRSSSLYTNEPNKAWHIYFGSDFLRMDNGYGRICGLSVRPVCSKDTPNDPTSNKITSVTLDTLGLSLKVGDGHLLKATAWSRNEEVDTATIIWKSDKNSVATVSAEGLVTAVAAGAATITATCQDKTASCVVTVSAAEEIQYEYVDLGLSVKWATFNVGATKPEEYGNYYAWGETVTKSTYNWSTYKWCNGSSRTLTKYCSDSNFGNNGFTDTKITLDLEDDVAHVKWGGTWRMPTRAEQDELRSNCTWTWYSSDNTEFKGVAGYKVTSNIEGYTDRSIFLPAAGSRYGSILDGVGSKVWNWSSSLRDSPSWAYCAYCLYSVDYGNVSAGGLNRYDGLSVRPVCP